MDTYIYGHVTWCDWLDQAHVSCIFLVTTVNVAGEAVGNAEIGMIIVTATAEEANGVPLEDMKITAHLGAAGNIITDWVHSVDYHGKGGMPSKTF